jgi:hypothetical protein
MDSRHPTDNLPDQDANNLLDEQNFEADLQVLQAEDFEASPEGGDFPNDGWQQGPRGNDDASSRGGIDLFQEENVGDDQLTVESNQWNPPADPVAAPPAAPTADPQAGNVPYPPYNLQHLGEAIHNAASTRFISTSNPPISGANTSAGPSSASNRPAVGANCPAGPTNTSNPPAAGANPSAGHSRTPLPAVFTNLPAGPGNIWDPRATAFNPPVVPNEVSNPTAAGVHPLARAIAAAAGVAGPSNTSSSLSAGANPIFRAIAATTGAVGVSGTGNTPSPPGTGATTPTSHSTSRFSSVFFHAPVGPSNTSSPSASGTTTPTSRRTSRYADTFANPPGRPSSTPISSGYLNQPRTGFLSNFPTTPSTPPHPPIGTPPAGPSITSNPAAAARSTDHIETEIHDIGGLLTTLEQSITHLTASYQSDQRVLLPALAQFARAANDQQTFSKAVLTGQEVREQWHHNVDINLGAINSERQRMSDNIDHIVQDQQEVMAHMRHWDRVHGLHQENLELLSRAQVNMVGNLHNIHIHLQRFVSAWDTNRTAVEENQRLILSQVSWLEPVALFFQFWGWFLRPFAVWRWWRAGRDGPPHRWGPGGPPPSPPPGGDGGGGGGGDGDVFGGQGGGVGADQQAGNQGGGQGGQQTGRVAVGGQQVGNQQAGGAQPAVQQAAQPAPGQFGSPFRADGIPYQPYRPPGTPDHEPIIPLFLKGQGTERAEREARRCRIMIDGIGSFLLGIILLANAVKYFYPELWAFYVPYLAVPTFRQYPGAIPDYTSAASPGPGAWLDEPVMKALFGARKEALTVAALAAQSVESVVACAKLVEDGNHLTTLLKEDWYEKLTKDTEGTCKTAVALGAEAAERMKALAGRLEWVLGEKWWATLTSKERSTRKTVVEERVQIATGEIVVDEITMAATMATETVTAGWQWPKRRVPAWL